MTIIDALFVTLGLDATGFKKGQKETQEALKKTRETTDAQGKEMEARAKLTADAFKKIKSEILGLVSVTGLVAFAARITDSDAAVGRLSKNLGVSTKELSAWEGMAKKFGGSAGDIDASFRKAFSISENIKLWSNDASLMPLSRLFGKPEDLAKFTQLAQSGDLVDMMKMLQSAVSSAPDKANAMSLLEQAGFSEDTFNVLREVGSQLEHNLQLQRDLNVASERDAELAIERQQAYSRLTDALTNMGRAILNSKGLNLTGIMNQDADAIVSATQDPMSVISWLSDTAGKMFAPFAASQVGTGLIQHFFGAHPAGGRRTVHGVVTDSVTGGAQGPGRLPRGARNLNPANLRFANQAGATSADGFAHFNSMADGVAATAQQLQLYAGRGILSVADIIQHWAPAADRNNVPAYVSDVSRRLGVSPNARLNLDSMDQMRQLIQAMAVHEGNGAYVNNDDLNAGLQLYTLRRMSGSKTDVHIAKIEVNTKATDAKGIARDLSDAVQDSYALASHANQSLQ